MYNNRNSNNSRSSFRSKSPYSSSTRSGSHFRGGPRSGGNFSRGRGGRDFSQHIDVSRFINKAVITEQVEHFVPEHAFSDFAISDSLKNNIKAKGYTLPTPIQDRAIPHIIRGIDVVGIANTGTGKTGAFLIPLINKVLTSPHEHVVIVVPTRELALQIDEEFKEFAKQLRIYSAVCVGGTSMGKQVSDLKRRPNFVIGTPGRLKDLIERKVLNLSGFNTVVLDEADRMLDMGFIHDMRFMMSHMPQVRHTLFFSATFSREIEGLVSEFLKEPVRISVKTQDTAKNVDQDIVKVTPDTTKLAMLQKLLAKPEFNKVLIFGRTKHGVEKLSRILNQSGFKVESIHGNKSQSQRQRALNSFKNNHIQTLVATDVAARGLDIDNVSHVINFDIPATYEDYIHRIGRTGRGDKKGKALTFVE
jgi:ATP-dependent RNA helicase RhlE